LSYESRTGRPDHNACTARVSLWLSRYLLILTTLSLLAMPITEHFWDWDRFLQTGRDFEIGLILLLSFLCLVMVLSRSYRHCVDALLSARNCLAAAFDNLVLSVPLAGALLNLQTVSPPDPGIYTSEMHLQI